jgi:hypothetical protein
MDEVGVKDSEDEFERWLEEREAILRMNKEFNLPRKTSDSSGNQLNARSTPGGEGERASATETGGVEESSS